MTSFSILQSISLLCTLGMVAFEWPLPLASGALVHRSLLPIPALIAALIDQGTNAGLSGLALYLLASRDCEV